MVLELKPAQERRSRRETRTTKRSDMSPSVPPASRGLNNQQEIGRLGDKQDVPRPTRQKNSSSSAQSLRSDDRPESKHEPSVSKKCSGGMAENVASPSGRTAHQSGSKKESVASRITRTAHQSGSRKENVASRITRVADQPCSKKESVASRITRTAHQSGSKKENVASRFTRAADQSCSMKESVASSITRTAHTPGSKKESVASSIARTAHTPGSKKENVAPSITRTAHTPGSKKESVASSITRTAHKPGSKKESVASNITRTAYQPVSKKRVAPTHTKPGGPKVPDSRSPTSSKRTAPVSSPVTDDGRRTITPKSLHPAVSTGSDLAHMNLDLMDTFRAQQKHLKTAERKLGKLKNAVKDIKVRSSLPPGSAPVWNTTDSCILHSPYLTQLAPGAKQHSGQRGRPKSFWKWAEIGLKLYKNIQHELQAYTSEGLRALLEDDKLEEEYKRRVKETLAAEINKQQRTDSQDIDAILEAIKWAMKGRSKSERWSRKRSTSPKKKPCNTRQTSMRVQMKSNSPKRGNCEGKEKISGINKASEKNVYQSDDSSSSLDSFRPSSRSTCSTSDANSRYSTSEYSSRSTRSPYTSDTSTPRSLLSAGLTPASNNYSDSDSEESSPKLQRSSTPTTTSSDKSNKYDYSSDTFVSFASTSSFGSSDFEDKRSAYKAHLKATKSVSDRSAITPQRNVGTAWDSSDHDPKRQAPVGIPRVTTKLLLAPKRGNNDPKADMGFKNNAHVLSNKGKGESKPTSLLEKRRSKSAKDPKKNASSPTNNMKDAPKTSSSAKNRNNGTGGSNKNDISLSNKDKSTLKSSYSLDKAQGITNKHGLKNGCSAPSTRVKGNNASKLDSSLELKNTNYATQAGKTRYAILPDHTKVGREPVRRGKTGKTSTIQCKRSTYQVKSASHYEQKKVLHSSSMKQTPTRALSVSDAIHQKVQTMQAPLSTKDKRLSQKQTHEKKPMPPVDSKRERLRERIETKREENDKYDRKCVVDKNKGIAKTPKEEKEIERVLKTDERYDARLFASATTEFEMYRVYEASNRKMEHNITAINKDETNGLRDAISSATADKSTFNLPTPELTSDKPPRSPKGPRRISPKKSDDICSQHRDQSLAQMHGSLAVKGSIHMARLKT